MFQVGDEVLHPLYGRVVVERIKKIEIRREIKTYLVLHVTGKKMKIMVPVDSVNEVGIRKLSNKTVIKETINILKDDKITLPKANWNSRYRLNMEKIVSGDIRQVAEVMKGLWNKNVDKGLSLGEKKLMNHAEQILVGEIMVSEQVTEKRAVQILDGYIH